MSNIEIIKPKLMTYRASGYVPIPPDHFKSFDVEVVIPNNMSREFFFDGKAPWFANLDNTNTDETVTLGHFIKKLNKTMAGRWSFQTKTDSTDKNKIILTIYVENEADQINYSFSL